LYSATMVHSSIYIRSMSKVTVTTPRRRLIVTMHSPSSSVRIICVHCIYSWSGFRPFGRATPCALGRSRNTLDTYTGIIGTSRLFIRTSVPDIGITLHLLTSRVTHRPQVEVCRFIVDNARRNHQTRNGFFQVSGEWL